MQGLYGKVIQSYLSLSHLLSTFTSGMNRSRWRNSVHRDIRSQQVQILTSGHSDLEEFSCRGGFHGLPDQDWRGILDEEKLINVEVLNGGLDRTTIKGPRVHFYSGSGRTVWSPSGLSADVCRTHILQCRGPPVHLCAAVWAYRSTCKRWQPYHD